MGNSSSNSARLESPSRPPSSRPPSSSRPPGSPPSNGSSHRVHRSLRTKKKSLELPDLASLTLTPASPSPATSPHAAYRRPRASSPIAIPAPANPPPQTFRPQNNLPSAANIRMNARSRYASYLDSAYPSTRDLERPPTPELTQPERPAFVQEIVHSTIPQALIKPDDDPATDPVPVVVRWRGTARSVVLARAGDDNWKGRQPMVFECVLSPVYICLLSSHPCHGANPLAISVYGRFLATMPAFAIYPPSAFCARLECFRVHSISQIYPC